MWDPFTKSARPETAKETEEPIYSNFDHQLDEEIKGQVQANPNKLYAQHAAYNFCGYVWYDGTKWKEEVWVYKEPQEVIEAETIEDLIDKVNLEYGSE